jgi:hypothetical protein
VDSDDERAVSSWDAVGDRAPEDRPAGVGAVFPAEGSRCEPSAAVGASVRVPPSEYTYSATLYLDGNDVGDRARIAEFMTHPRSMVQISYAPTEPLSPGEHSVRIEYSDVRGAEWHYSWRFYVD